MYIMTAKRLKDVAVWASQNAYREDNKNYGWSMSKTAGYTSIVNRCVKVLKHRYNIEAHVDGETDRLLFKSKGDTHYAR